MQQHIRTFERPKTFEQNFQEYLNETKKKTQKHLKQNDF